MRRTGAKRQSRSFRTEQPVQAAGSPVTRSGKVLLPASSSASKASHQAVPCAALGQLSVSEGLWASSRLRLSSMLCRWPGPLQEHMCPAGWRSPLSLKRRSWTCLSRWMSCCA